MAKANLEELLARHGGEDVDHLAEERRRTKDRIRSLANRLSAEERRLDELEASLRAELAAADRRLAGPTLCACLGGAAG